MNHESHIITEIGARKAAFKNIVHERTGLKILKGALVNEHVMELAVEGLPETVVHKMLSSKEVEPDVLINRSHRSDFYIERVDEICIDGLELGPGEQWRHRDGTQVFYVLKSVRLSTAKALVMKGLFGIVKLRDGGIGNAKSSY